MRNQRESGTSAATPPAAAREDVGGGDDRELDDRHVLEPEGVGDGKHDVAGHRGEERRADREPRGEQPGGHQTRTREHRDSGRKVTGGDGTQPLDRVAPVAVGVGGVVEEIGTARRGTEAPERAREPPGRRASAEDSGGGRSSEHRAVLDPLPRPRGAKKRGGERHGRAGGRRCRRGGGAEMLTAGSCGRRRRSPGRPGSGNAWRHASCWAAGSTGRRRSPSRR